MDNEEYKSIDLLWAINKPAADRLTCCYAAILFIYLDLSAISSPEGMWSYIKATNMLYSLYWVDNPEDYLEFKNNEEAWKTWDFCSAWLNEMQVPESIFLFKDSARIIMNKYLLSNEEPVRISPCISDLGKVGRSLGVNQEQAVSLLMGMIQDYSDEA